MLRRSKNWRRTQKNFKLQFMSEIRNLKLGSQILNENAAPTTTNHNYTARGSAAGAGMFLSINKRSSGVGQG